MAARHRNQCPGAAAGPPQAAAPATRPLQPPTCSGDRTFSSCSFTTARRKSVSGREVSSLSASHGAPCHAGMVRQWGGTEVRQGTWAGKACGRARQAAWTLGSPLFSEQRLAGVACMQDGSAASQLPERESRAGAGLSAPPPVPRPQCPAPSAPPPNAPRSRHRQQPDATKGAASPVWRGWEGGRVGGLRNDHDTHEGAGKSPREAPGACSPPTTPCASLPPGRC